MYFTGNWISQSKQETIKSGLLGRLPNLILGLKAWFSPPKLKVSGASRFNKCSLVLVKVYIILS